MKQQVNLSNFEQLAWGKMEGLLPAVVQEKTSRKIMMLAYMSKLSLERTLTAGVACFYSRSRQELWTKGETSGNTLTVINITTDCDLDSLLLTVEANGPVCHRLTESCFDHRFAAWDELWVTIEERAKLSTNENVSYTRRLLSAGIHKIAQKVGEEAVETILAAKDDDDPAFLGEAADLIYHFLVLLKAKGLDPSDVGKVLMQRQKIST